jgi:predicted transcriptional regulator
VSALVGGEDSSELLDLLVAEGRNEAVDIKLLDRTLDDALGDVVEAEAVHEAADGAGVQVKDAGRVTLCANEATDGAGSKAEDVTGLALDDAVGNVSDVKTVGEAAGGARLQAKHAGRVALGANEATNRTGSKAEDITGLTLDNLVKNVGDVQSLSGAANGARAKVEGLAGVSRATEDGANGAGAKVKGVTGVTLDDLVEDVSNVKAISGAANGARAKVKGLVRVAGATEDGADRAGAKVQGVARVTLDNVVEDVSNVKAISGAANGAGAQVEGLVGLARAENGANSARAKVQGVAGVALDDVVDGVAKVEAVGDTTDEARVEAKGLVSVAAVATKDGADGTGAKVEGVAGVTLEAKTDRVDGVGDGVEERGGGATDKGKVALDDREVEVAESRVEVDAGEKVVDEGITLDDAADSLAEAEGAENTVVAEKAVEDVALGGNINVDVVDDVLDLVHNTALEDVQAADSVEGAVDGATEAAANEAIDEVAGLDTDLDTVDSVLDAVDSSRDTSGKGVLDDAALDTEAKARNDGKAAGDSADVDDVVETTKSLTLGGHGEGGRRKGESDKSVLHLEKGVWCVLTKVVSW